MVSVILLNYNGRKNLGDLLEGCLESVLNTDYPNFEVLFVDNASTDDSVQFIERKIGRNKRLRIIKNEKNFGFAEGNNIGIRNAKGEYIALLNNDTKVDPKWLKELVKAIQQPEIGAAQSKLLQMDNPDLLDCAGGFVDYYGYSYSRGHGQKAHKYNRIDDIFYAKGAAFIVKQEVLKRVGLFDPETFMYYEETDLCWRIWLNGYRIVFVPSSIIYHAPGSTISTLQEQTSLYFLTKNHMLTLIKNYGMKNMLKALTAFLFLELRKAIALIPRRKQNSSFAIIRALMWNLFHLKYIWERRQITQKLIRRIPDESIKGLMYKPFPPFPHSLIFPKSRYLRKT